MAPDGRKDGRTEGRTDRQGQIYIPPLSAGDNKTQTKSKAGSWIEGQVATLLELHTRQTDTIDTSTMKRAKKKKYKKNNQEETKQKCRLGMVVFNHI